MSTKNEYDDGITAEDRDVIIKRQMQCYIDQRNESRRHKDAAYRERNQLVAALSKIFPAHLLIHPAADATWEDGWRTIVCVHLPAGQATWHFHDSERELVAHLEGVNVVKCTGWDGHTTEEKYRRLAALQAGM